MSAKRIAWLSPYGPRSDIGAFTRNLLPHLHKPDHAHEFDVHLWINENGESYPSAVPAVPFGRFKNQEAVLSLYDFQIFNVGNNVENHLDIFGALKVCPGVVVLHDFVYQHFFAYECFQNKKSPAAYARMMGEFYGKAALEVIDRSGICLPGAALFAPWDSDHAVDFPLHEMVTGLSSAVVVHSDFAFEQVRKKFKGPMLKLALPYDQKRMLSEANIADWRRRTVTARPVQYTCFGHISRSKLLHRVVEAFADSSWLRENARLLIAGHPGEEGYLEELRRLIVWSKLESTVSIELSVSDERLLQIKTAADVFINIRYPNTEAGSGSLVEQLNTGRPVVVHDSGCYADLGDDAGLKWHVNRGLTQLVNVLERAGKDPELRIEVGRQGLAHVRRIGGAEYATQLKAFLLDIEPRLKVVMAASVSGVTAAPSPADSNPDIERVTQARRQWQLLDSDALGMGPGPFLSWPAEAAALYAAILVGAGPGSEFRKLAEREARADAVLLYDVMCALRALLRSMAHMEAEGGEIVGPPRCFDPAVWEFAAQLDATRFARVMFVGLEGSKPGNGLEFWMALLRAGIPPRVVLWAFLKSEDVQADVQYRQQIARLADWAVQGRAEASLARRVAGYAIASGALKAKMDAAEFAPLEPGDFDEADYFSRHPDVAKAVKDGAFASGYEHFMVHGVREKRAFSLRFPELKAIAS